MTLTRIEMVLPRDGEYVIRVNPVSEATGRYVLEVESSFVEDYDGGDNVQDVVDRDLVGRWGLVVPGSRVNPDSWSSVAGAARRSTAGIKSQPWKLPRMTQWIVSSRSGSRPSSGCLRWPRRRSRWPRDGSTRRRS